MQSAKSSPVSKSQFDANNIITAPAISCQTEATSDAELSVPIIRPYSHRAMQRGAKKPLERACADQSGHHF